MWHTPPCRLTPLLGICHASFWPIRLWPFRLTSSSRICHTSSWPIGLFLCQSTLSSGIRWGMSCILLTHRIMTMLIDFVIKDPSCILLTHRIVTMPIDSVIRDSSRDVMHPPDPSVWKSTGQDLPSLDARLLQTPCRICMLPTYMPLYGNNLHTMPKDPTMQSNFPYIGREDLRSWGP